MIIPGQHIKKWIEHSDPKQSQIIAIEPIPSDIQYGPSSVDLRIGSQSMVVSRDQSYTIHNNEIPLPPHETVLASTVETVRLGKKYCAMLKGRSSIGRKGIIIHTAGWVDAGFEGQLTLEIINNTSEQQSIPIGSRVCQLVVMEMSQEAEHGYGEIETSKYQGQEGPTPSKANSDPDIDW